MVLRVDPQTNLVDKSIEGRGGADDAGGGERVRFGVLGGKEGKVDRIDPKTNKVTKSIELGAPAGGGAMAFGEGSLWVSMPGFPVTRIDPQGGEGSATVLRRGRRISADYAELVMAGGHGGGQADAPRHTPYCRHSGGK